MFSFEPKTQQNFFLISALAYKKRANKKLYHIIMSNIISNIKSLYSFDPTSFKRLGQKSKNILVGSNENKKIYFQNYLTFRGKQAPTNLLYIGAA